MRLPENPAALVRFGLAFRAIAVGLRADDENVSGLFWVYHLSTPARPATHWADVIAVKFGVDAICAQRIGEFEHTLLVLA